MARLPVIVCILLAGCFNGHDAAQDEADAPEAPWPFPMAVETAESGQCAGYACLASGTEAFAIEAEAMYGHRALTSHGGNMAQITTELEDDWLIWQDSIFPPEGESYEAVFAYDFVNQTMYSVSSDNGTAMRPFYSEGLVVFKYSAPSYSGMVQWRLGERHAAPLEFLHGQAIDHFDLLHDWLIVAMQNDTGRAIVAWNVETDQRWDLYRVLAEGAMNFHGAILGPGHAYTLVQEGGCWCIQQLNLTTGQEEVFQIRGTGPRFLSAPDLVYIQDTDDIHVLDPATGEYAALGLYGEKGSRVGGSPCGTTTSTSRALWMRCFFDGPDDEVNRFYWYENGTILDLPGLGEGYSAGWSRADDQRLVRYWVHPDERQSGGYSANLFLKTIGVGPSQDL